MAQPLDGRTQPQPLGAEGRVGPVAHRHISHRVPTRHAVTTSTSKESLTGRREPSSLRVWLRDSR